MKHIKQWNFLLVALTLVLCVIYRLVGGLWLKGITSSSFALLGWVNLIFAIRSGQQKLGFSVWMTAALTLSVAADIALNLSFIHGALLFATAHGLYILAYCTLERLCFRDILFAAAVAVISLSVVSTPWDPLLRLIVTVYALVISAMVGKALSNYSRRRDRLCLILLAGSLLFWVSDLALSMEYFAGGGYLADTICLLTYFPGQAILAHALYYYSAEK